MEPDLQKESINRGRKNTTHELSEYGITSPAAVYWNLTTEELYDEIKRKREAVITPDGVVLVDTGEHTGRSANDKFIVREPSSEDKIWWGPVNKEFPREKFNSIKERMMAYLDGRELYVRDTYVGADPTYQLPVRIISEPRAM